MRVPLGSILLVCSFEGFLELGWAEVLAYVFWVWLPTDFGLVDSFDLTHFGAFQVVAWRLFC